MEVTPSHLLAHFGLFLWLIWALPSCFPLKLFPAIFFAEALMKLIGLGFRGYFKERWNQFDFFVVCSSSVSILLEIFEIEAAATKIFRVIRLVCSLTHLFSKRSVCLCMCLYMTLLHTQFWSNRHGM